MHRYFLIPAALSLLLVADARGVEAVPLPQERSPEIIRTDHFNMVLGSRLQLRFTWTDPDEGTSNGSFAVRRARVSLGGEAWEHFQYQVQVGLEGGSATLLDANVTHRLAPMAGLWVGQGKAHFGRQQLTSSGNLHFVDRTIVDGRFSAGRQAGVALTGRNASRSFEYGVGVYNGTGMNSANDNGRYMIAGRAVLTPFGPYSPAEGAFDAPESPQMALGVGGLRTTTGSGVAATDITRLNLESAFKVGGFNATGEFYWERAEAAGAPELTTVGWYVQPGFLFPGHRYEVALRYAVISPDTPTDTDVIETGVALSRYLHQHRAKIQADLRDIERRATGAGDLQFRVQLQLTL